MNNRNVLIIAIVAIVAIGASIIIYSSNNKKTSTNMASDNSKPTDSTSESYSTAPQQNTGKTEKGGERLITTPTPSNLPTPTVIPSKTAATGSKELSVDQKLAMSKPDLKVDQKKSYTAMIKTSLGDITVELDVKDTPITANNFIELAKSGFYKNTIFHRVIKDFMIQGGDPKGTGNGGPNYAFDDEAFKCGGETETRKPDYTKDPTQDLCVYSKGLLAMANHGQNTNGSQFFIMHKDTPLPHRYVVFGKVLSGQEVVDKIASVEVEADAMGAQSKPVTDVNLIDVIVTEK